MATDLELVKKALTFSKPMIGALCADSPTATTRERRGKVYALVVDALEAIKKLELRLVSELKNSQMNENLLQMMVARGFDRRKMEWPSSSMTDEDLMLRQRNRIEFLEDSLRLIEMETRGGSWTTREVNEEAQRGLKETS